MTRPASASEAAHTPGPWTATNDGWGPMVHAGDMFVADCEAVGGDTPSDEEQDANAILIAAAPDLADVVADCLRRHGKCGRPGCWCTRGDAALRKAGRLP